VLRTLAVAIALSSSLFAFGNQLAQQNRQEIMQLKQMIAEQNERLDGLTSLVEGMSGTLAKLEQQRRYAPKNDAKYDELKTLIQDLGKMIDTINASYLSKEAFQAYVAKGEVSATVVPEKPKEQKPQATPSELYSKGVRLFVKKHYDEAKKAFEESAKRGYKPAASNYYLGEIAYYTKQNKEALYYYKKSASLYDKAGYMDVLLLHTAIALERMGKRDQANAFYENVIANYPKGKAAAIAKKRVGRE